MKGKRAISYPQLVAYVSRLSNGGYSHFMKDVTLRRRVLAGEVTIKRPFPGIQIVIVNTSGSNRVSI